MRIRLPKPRYSLAVLLLLVAGLALVFAWLLPHWEAKRALEQFQYTQAMYETDTATAIDLYNASERLFQAELRAPFCTDYDAHSDRVTHIDAMASRLEQQPHKTMYGSNEARLEAHRRAAEMRERHAAAVREFEALFASP